MVAPYGRNGCAGSSTLYSSCGVQVASKCSGIRHSLPRARSCTTRVTTRSARSRNAVSPSTSAADSSASTVCMFALTPR